MQHGTENTWTEGTLMPHQGTSALFPVGHLRIVLARALKECVMRILLFLLSHTHTHTLIHTFQQSGQIVSCRQGLVSVQTAGDCCFTSKATSLLSLQALRSDQQGRYWFCFILFKKLLHPDKDTVLEGQSLFLA